jgi:hypothetical protein
MMQTFGEPLRSRESNARPATTGIPIVEKYAPPTIRTAARGCMDGGRGRSTGTNVVIPPPPPGTSLIRAAARTPGSTALRANNAS